MQRQADTATRPACSPAPTRSIPTTGQPVPVFIADYVLMGYGTGAIMAVPRGDQRDFEFARQFGLPIPPIQRAARRVVRRAGHRADARHATLADGLRRRGRRT